MRQLLALTPAEVGSGRDALFLHVDGRFGYWLEAPGRWQAIFGQYTPSVRPPSLVARQVQCLRALLSRREDDIGRVNLAAAPGSCGTFVPDGAMPTPRRPERGRSTS
jgi:hypothetical protein